MRVLLHNRIDNCATMYYETDVEPHSESAFRNFGVFKRRHRRRRRRHRRHREKRKLRASARVAGSGET